MADVGKPIRRIKSVPEKPSVPVPEPVREPVKEPVPAK